MTVTRIRKGFDVPLSGGIVSDAITDGPPIKRVALLPQESPGIKVKMLVKEGAPIKLGAPLFHDKRDPDVAFTAPGSGTVEAVIRGAKRLPLAVVVALDGDDAVDFSHLQWETKDQVRAALLESGAWTSIRRRPLDVVARSTDEAAALFITAMDTAPLAPSPLAVLAGREDAFRIGLKAL
ncbi:MAG: hypothetical protein MK213_05840, partial [Planctomycetes bacterium]|nr:hypothetical protein [Planctomycetota bacterium]